MIDHSLRVRAILVGTATYESSKIPDVPAVPATVQSLAEALAANTSFADSQIDVLLDPATPGEVGDAIGSAAESATKADMLIVYYVGHGFVHHNGELYLATSSADSTPGRMTFRSTRYADVREMIQNSSAQAKVVILDCCFSGQAIDTLAVSEYVDLAGIRGTCVLVAAPPNELALAKKGETFTAFTGELIDLLRRGDPTCEKYLTLRSIYRVLSVRMPELGCPRPQCKSLDLLDEFPFALNVSYVPHGVRFANLGIEVSRTAFAEVGVVERTPRQQAEVEIAGIAREMLQSGLDITLANVAGGGIRIYTPGGAAIDLPMTPKALVEQPWWLEIDNRGDLVVIKQTIDKGDWCGTEYLSGGAGDVMAFPAKSGGRINSSRLILNRRPPSRHSLKVEFSPDEARYPKFNDRAELTFAEEKAMLRDLRVSEEAIGNRQWSRLSDR